MLCYSKIFCRHGFDFTRVYLLCVHVVRLTPYWPCNLISFLLICIIIVVSVLLYKVPAECITAVIYWIEFTGCFRTSFAHLFPRFLYPVSFLLFAILIHRSHGRWNTADR